MEAMLECSACGMAQQKTEKYVTEHLGLQYLSFT